MMTSEVWRVKLRTMMTIDATALGQPHWEILVPAEHVNEALYRVRESLFEDVQKEGNASSMPGYPRVVGEYEIVSAEKTEDKVITGPSGWGVEEEEPADDPAVRITLLEKILCEALQAISSECGTKQCHDYVEGLVKEAGLGPDWFYGENAER